MAGIVLVIVGAWHAGTSVAAACGASSLAVVAEEVGAEASNDLEVAFAAGAAAGEDHPFGPVVAGERCCSAR